MHHSLNTTLLKQLFLCFFLLSVTSIVAQDFDNNQSFSTESDCKVSAERGAADANLSEERAWLGAGAVSGCSGGLFGALIVSGISQLTPCKPKVIPGGVNEACYAEGYKIAKRRNRFRKSSTGGLIGTAVIVVLILVSVNS